MEGTPLQPKKIHVAALEREAIVIDYSPTGIDSDPHKEHKGKPVAQAVGVRRFSLVDGIPLSDVEIFERVTLVREVTRLLSQPIDVKGTKFRKITVVLACLPGPERTSYCYSLTELDPWTEDLLREAIQSEGGWALLVDSPSELVKIVSERGLPEKILVVPQRPLSYNELTDIAKENLLEAVKKIIQSDEKTFVEFFNVAEPINIRLHALDLFAGIGKKTVQALLERRSQKPFESFEEIKKVIRSDPVELLTNKIVEEIKGEAKYYLFVEPADYSAPFLDYPEKIRRSLQMRKRGGGVQAFT
ncbi:MAG: DUF655 domain-containing protein [Acidilobaceae archaeon]